MIDTKKWLPSLQGWLKTLFIIGLVIITFSYIIKDIFYKPDAEIQKLKKQVERRNLILDNLKNELSVNELAFKKIRKDMNKDRGEFVKLQREFDNYKKIKPPVIIKTLTKVQIIKEYERVYNFAKRTLDMFSVAVQNGIDIDAEINKLFPIIKDYVKTSEENTTDREKIITLQRKRSRWGITVGCKLIGSDGKNLFNDFQIMVSFGYKIL